MFDIQFTLYIQKIEVQRYLLVVRFSQTLFHKLPQFLLFHRRGYSLLVIDLFVDCNTIPQVRDTQKHSLCKCILTTYANTTSDKSLHCRGAVSRVDATSSWLSHTVTTTSYTIYCTLLTLIMTETSEGSIPSLTILFRKMHTLGDKDVQLELVLKTPLQFHSEAQSYTHALTMIQSDCVD